MKRMTLITGAALAVVASAALAFATAHAETKPVVTAIKACSTVNPRSRWKSSMRSKTAAVSAGNRWMCDADSDGNVYSYSLVTWTAQAPS